MIEDARYWLKKNLTIFVPDWRVRQENHWQNLPIGSYFCLISKNSNKITQTWRTVRIQNNNPELRMQLRQLVESSNLRHDENWPWTSRTAPCNQSTVTWLGLHNLPVTLQLNAWVRATILITTNSPSFQLIITVTTNYLIWFPRRHFRNDGLQDNSLAAKRKLASFDETGKKEIIGKLFDSPPGISRDCTSTSNPLLESLPSARGGGGGDAERIVVQRTGRGKSSTKWEPQ
jgi:hypothetical protein